MRSDFWSSSNDDDDDDHFFRVNETKHDQERKNPSAYHFYQKNFNGFETLTKTSFELVLMKQLREDTWFFGVRMLLDNSKFF